MIDLVNMPINDIKTYIPFSYTTTTLKPYRELMLSETYHWGTGNEGIYIEKGNFWIGDRERSKAPFRVDRDGTTYINNKKL